MASRDDDDPTDPGSQETLHFIELIHEFDGKHHVVIIKSVDFPIMRARGRFRYKTISRACYMLGDEFAKLGEAEERAFIWEKGKGKDR